MQDNCTAVTTNLYSLQVICDFPKKMDSPQPQRVTRDGLPFAHNIVSGEIFPPFIRQERVDDLKTFQLRSDDVFIDTYPKSGSWFTILSTAEVHVYNIPQGCMSYTDWYSHGCGGLCEPLHFYIAAHKNCTRPNQSLSSNAWKCAQWKVTVSWQISQKTQVSQSCQSPFWALLRKHLHLSLAYILLLKRAIDSLVHCPYKTSLVPRPPFNTARGSGNETNKKLGMDVLGWVVL